MSNETLDILEDMRNNLQYSPETGQIKYFTKRGPKNPGDTCGNMDCQGYIRVYYKDRWFMGHRVAWALYHGYWPKGTIDHIDRVKQNNKISNLRDVTQGKNNINKTPYGKRSNHYKGVYKHGKYFRVIFYDVKTKEKMYLGCFSCPTKAAIVYDEAAKKHRVSGNFC